MFTKKLTFRDAVYWGMVSLVSIVIGYLLVTLFHASERDETAFSEGTRIAQKAKFVVLDTSAGQIRIELLRREAPNTVNNFVALAHAGFYDETKFHRVVAGMLIQGGDPLSREADRELYGTGGPGYVFEDELRGIPMERGVVAMANLGRPKTNGSQFFILVTPQSPLLDGRYTVFGKVVSGMEVVDQINLAAVDAHQIPLKPVGIEGVIIE